MIVCCVVIFLRYLRNGWRGTSAVKKTRGRYIRRCGDIISAVLKTISQDNAGNLWQVLQSTPTVNKVLGNDHLSLSQKQNMEAFAEVYRNAESWDTRRQVLSVMTGLASYATILLFIPSVIVSMSSRSHT